MNLDQPGNCGFHTFAGHLSLAAICCGYIQRAKPALSQYQRQRRQLTSAGSSPGSGRPCLAAESHTIKLCEDLSSLYGQFNYLPCALHLQAFDLLGGLLTE